MIHSAESLIENFGRAVNDRRCGRCKEFTLHAIDYEDVKRTRVLLCSRCDVAPHKVQEAA